MTAGLTCYRAGWVLPVAGPPIRDGEVLVDPDGIIVSVAPAGAIELSAGTSVENLGNAVILPGLVNVHAHPELAMFRGALEDLPFRDWILRLVGAKRTLLNAGDSGVAARWTIVEALRAGMTTIGATEASGAAVGAMVEAGVRGIVYQEVFGPDPAQAGDSGRQLVAELESLLSLGTDLVKIGVSPHAPYTVSDDLYRGATRIARELGLPLAVHIAESAIERALVTAGEGDFAPGLRARGIATPARGRSSIELLERLGVLEAAPLLIHCVDVDGDDIARIAASGCPVAHCPVANARLGHGVAPVLDLLEAGVNVALGTDSVGSNNRLDLLEEGRVASLLQRGISARYDALPAAALLRMCTIEGARALGLDDRIGSLEPGKDADLCVVSLDGHHTVPSFDPVDSLFHSARGSDVILTMVKGRQLFRDGVVTSLDEKALRKGVEEAADRLRDGR